MSSTMAETGKEDDIDRISGLPEPIIHHIMSFLPPQDASKVGLLSKNFNSLWLSFPILDFNVYNLLPDEIHVTEEWVRTQLFVDSIHRFLQRRRHQMMITRNSTPCLEKLTFKAFLCQFGSDERVNGLLKFALENKVKVLNFDSTYCDDVAKEPYERMNLYRFPDTIFSAESVTSLDLRGLVLEPRDLALSCPSIVTFILKSCNGVRSINIRGAAKLRELDLFNCPGLREIHIHAPTSLESFSFDNMREPCEMNFNTSCESLKDLTLMGVCITDKSVKPNFSRFFYVEKLTLWGCSLPNKTKLYFENLKWFMLQSGLCELAEINAPKLEWFGYNGSVRSQNPLVMASNTKRIDAEVCFKPDHAGYALRNRPLDRSYEDYAPKCLYFKLLRDFSRPFSHYCYLKDFIRPLTHCQTLTLNCRSSKDFIYPKEMRDTLDPPFCDTKHLDVKLYMYSKEDLEDIKDIVELVDNMLWLAPRPDKITIHGGQALKWRVMTIKLIYYQEPVSGYECCGLRRRAKCWRHYLKEVALENFEYAHERNRLKKYFSSVCKFDPIFEH